MKLKIWEASGKYVRVRLHSGTVLEGYAYDYTSRLDNEEGMGSLTINSVEFFEDEVETIEEIKAPEQA